METDIQDKIEPKNKFLYFYNVNKFKIYILGIILIIISILGFFYKTNLEKNNSLIAENYVKAGLYLAAGKNNESLNIYKKIIYSKNEIYSILALNTILEKNLISEQEIILDYFLYIEKKIHSKELKDLLLFKRALYLMKNKKNNEAEKILSNLIDSKSKIKSLVKEVITK